MGVLRKKGVVFVLRLRGFGYPLPNEVVYEQTEVSTALLGGVSFEFALLSEFFQNVVVLVYVVDQ